MKKKVLSLALAVALVAIAVGGSLAYFADSDAVTNTFTLGSVKIEIYENKAATPSAEQGLGTLLPVVNTTPSADVNYKNKVVEVKNTGASKAYIRVLIAVPAELDGYLHLDWNDEGWLSLDEYTVSYEGQAYMVYAYDFENAVESGKFTNELLQGVYLGSDVDLKENEKGDLVFVRKEEGKIIDESTFVAHRLIPGGLHTSNEINILVAAQAIQADGFGNATDALNTGFGVNSNPWG